MGATVVLVGLSLLLPSRLLATVDGAAWEAKFRAVGGALMAVLAGLIAVVVYFRLHGAGALERRLAGWRTARGWRRRFAVQFGGFSEGLQSIRTFGDLAAASFYSAAHWFVVIVVYFWIAQASAGGWRRSTSAAPCWCSSLRWWARRCSCPAWVAAHRS